MISAEILATPVSTSYYLGMVVRISRLLLDAICADAEEKDPLECCGLLLGRQCAALAGGTAFAEVVEVRPAANVAADPRTRFEVDPSVLISAHRQARGGGLAVLGHYHSHPRGEPVPSLVDAAMAQLEGEIWLLVGRGGEARAWRAVLGGTLHGCFEPAELTVSPQARVAPEGGDRHESTDLA